MTEPICGWLRKTHPRLVPSVDFFQVTRVFSRSNQTNTWHNIPGYAQPYQRPPFTPTHVLMCTRVMVMLNFGRWTSKTICRNGYSFSTGSKAPLEKFTQRMDQSLSASITQFCYIFTLFVGLVALYPFDRDNGQSSRCPKSSTDTKGLPLHNGNTPELPFFEVSRR